MNESNYNANQILFYGIACPEVTVDVDRYIATPGKSPSI